MTENYAEVKNVRQPGYVPLQRAALVLLREGEVPKRLSSGGNSYRQRNESYQALLESARDENNTALARAGAILQLEPNAAEQFITSEASSDVCTALALISNNKELGVLAATKILEKDAILEVAVYAPWPEVRKVVQDKLTARRDIEAALKSEDDDKLLHSLKRALKNFPKH